MEFTKTVMQYLLHHPYYGVGIQANVLFKHKYIVDIAANQDHMVMYMYITQYKELYYIFTLSFCSKFIVVSYVSVLQCLMFS